MTMSRRHLLAGVGAAAATTLLARSAAAQSFPFTPNQRYPDPAVQILDPGFAKYRIYSSTIEQVSTGMRWAEGPAYFPEGGYLLFSDIPNNRIMKFDEDQPDLSLPRQCQLRQRQCARPSGSARHLRALGHPPRHPHREGRQDHCAGG
jgi:gluconolactonase